MKARTPIFWKHLASLIVGAAGLATALPAAGVLSIFALGAVFQDDPKATPQAFLAAGLLATSLFGLPLVWFGLSGMSGRPTGRGMPTRFLSWSPLLIPVALAAGHLALNRGILPWLIGPAAHLLATGTFVMGLVLLARHWGTPASPHRAWSQFVAGLWGAPAILLPVEFALLALPMVVVAVGIALLPGGMEHLQALSELRNTAADPAGIATLALRPLTAVGVFFAASVAIPLLEELVKPLGSMLAIAVAARPTPAQAFLGGALSGAGYALVEALFIADPGPAWALIVVARMGTSAMHVFTSGLVGWGLGEAFVRRRPRRLALSYAGAVITHGLWNGLVISEVYAGLLLEYGQGAIWKVVSPVILVGGSAALIVLAIAAVVGIGAVSRRLSR